MNRSDLPAGYEIDWISYENRYVFVNTVIGEQSGDSYATAGEAIRAACVDAAHTDEDQELQAAWSEALNEPRELS